MKQQRTEDDSHKPEYRQADDYSENSDKRMCIRHLLLKDEPDKVVRLRYDDSSIAKKPDGVEPVSADGKISGYRKPYQCRTYHRNDGCKAGQESQHQYVGCSESR